MHTAPESKPIAVGCILQRFVMPRQYPYKVTITASEVAEFMFCAKAWQLQREGVEADSPHLAPGTAFHRQHGRQISLATRLRQVGWVGVALALLLLIILCWKFKQ